MVIWVIGLSGAGKSTLAAEILRSWRSVEPNTVLIDGDIIRALFGHEDPETSYTLEGRRINAERIQQLCRWLDAQGMNVVCSILSVFEESRTWCRQNLSSYYEVFVDVPMDVLIRERDYKGLYKAALAGRQRNVVGIDLPFERPASPDFVFVNTGARQAAIRVAQDVLRLANAHGVKKP